MTLCTYQQSIFTNQLMVFLASGLHLDPIFVARQNFHNLIRTRRLSLPLHLEIYLLADVVQGSCWVLKNVLPTFPVP